MEPVLSQQVGLDVGRAGSQQTGLLQKRTGTNGGKRRRKKYKDSIRDGSGCGVSAMVYLPNEGKHLKEKDLGFLHMAYR